MIGPQPCAYACVYRDPVFTSQSYDIIICLCQPSQVHLVTDVLLLLLLLVLMRY